MAKFPLRGPEVKTVVSCLWQIKNHTSPTIYCYSFFQSPLRSGEYG